MDAVLLTHLHPEKLTERAAEAVRQCTIRFHEIPAKDLPAVALTLLDLAERQKPKRGKAKPTDSPPEE